MARSNEMQNTGPKRSGINGDVAGTKPIDVTLGEAIDVAKASYDPGYEFGAAIGWVESKADLLRGYCDYGRGVGDPDDGLDDWDNWYAE